jgi:hypothetical protein
MLEARQQNRPVKIGTQTTLKIQFFHTSVPEQKKTPRFLKDKHYDAVFLPKSHIGGQRQAASNCFSSPAAANAPTDSQANYRLAGADGPGPAGWRRGWRRRGGLHCLPALPNPLHKKKQAPFLTEQYSLYNSSKEISQNRLVPQHLIRHDVKKLLIK